MTHNSKGISEKGSSLSANAHHDVMNFKFHEMLTSLKKINFLRMEHKFSMK